MQPTFLHYVLLAVLLPLLLLLLQLHIFTSVPVVAPTQDAQFLLRSNKAGTFT